MEIEELIKNTIEDIWLNEIKKDYINNLIVNEDTLKSSFYFHLRNKLTDEILIDKNIKIFTEFRLTKFNKRVDIAIIKLKNEREIFFHYKESIESVLVLIELKYKPLRVYRGNPMLVTEDLTLFHKDLFKLCEYGKVYKNCQLYGAFIHEYFYNHKLKCLNDISHFIDKEILSRMTELIGYNSEGSQEFVTDVNQEI